MLCLATKGFPQHLCGHAWHRPMKNTISGNPAKAMMKLLVAADSDKVVGVHMVGPECAEIMQARPPCSHQGAVS